MSPDQAIVLVPASLGCVLLLLQWMSTRRL
jgi:hypothetical protein